MFSLNSVSRLHKVWLTILLALALGFRLFIALHLPNDTPDDGRVYSQIARNLLEQGVYSHEEQAPYLPTIIRLPGYPLFLAAVYSIAGHGNNTAVRVAQAVLDTCTCFLVAVVAFFWAEDGVQKGCAAVAALALAALCPFTTIYVATILTEVPTSLLAVLICFLTTVALKTNSQRRALWLWCCCGLVAGLAVFFRPDSGLFAAAVGFTILLSSLVKKPLVKQFGKSAINAAVFSVAFCLVLVPWTIRNRRVFGVFQPLSPAHGEMPGEFVPRGYLMWLRTWVDDGRYVGPVLWQLDTAPIGMEAFPNRAFDSAEERERIAKLMAQYNHAGNQDAGTGVEQSEEDDNEEESDESSGQEEGPGENSQNDVEMTPEIDAGFAQIARERISRAPFRYYVKLPLKRASSLWFDTHSQYYPFDGELFPLNDLDYDNHQQYWLPLFAGLTWLYTILGVIGGGLLWRSQSREAKVWVVLVALIIFLRIGFFSTLENPEPRYVVEVFPFLAILGGITLSRVTQVLRTRLQARGSQ